MTDTIPAAWHPDPYGEPLLRWWDGATWTNHTAALPDALPSPPASTANRSSGRSSLFRRTRDKATVDAAGVGTVAQGADRPVREPVEGRTHAPAVRGDVRRIRAVPPWTGQLTTQNVVGESQYAAEFKALAYEHGHRSVPDYGVELAEATATLVPETENRYDPNAVAVWIDGRHQAGYLPRDVAAVYSPLLCALDAGTHLSVPARVWVGWTEDYDSRTGESKRLLLGSASVKLPDRCGITPFNDLPDVAHTVLPWGRAIQLSGEEHHMDVLRTLTLGSDPRHVAVSLHVVQEPRRSGDPVRQVEVRLDDQRIGVMSKALSDQVADLVSFVSNQGSLPVARAVVKGSNLRADVAVHVARTIDVPQRWLDAVDATGT